MHKLVWGAILLVLPASGAFAQDGDLERRMEELKRGFEDARRNLEREFRERMEKLEQGFREKGESLKREFGERRGEGPREDHRDGSQGGPERMMRELFQMVRRLHERIEDLHKEVERLRGGGHDREEGDREEHREFRFKLDPEKLPEPFRRGLEDFKKGFKEWRDDDGDRREFKLFKFDREFPEHLRKWLERWCEEGCQGDKKCPKGECPCPLKRCEKDRGHDDKHEKKEGDRKHHEEKEEEKEKHPDEEKRDHDRREYEW